MTLISKVTNDTSHKSSLRMMKSKFNYREMRSLENLPRYCNYKFPLIAGIIPVCINEFGDGNIIFFNSL